MDNGVAPVTLDQAVQRSSGCLCPIFFPRLTLGAVWRLARRAPRGERLRTLCRKLGHWAGNSGIALFQLVSHPGWWRLPFWEFSHVGILIDLVDDDGVQRWFIVQANLGDGVTATDAQEVVDGYHAPLNAVPLSWPPDLAASARLRAWVRLTLGMDYDAAGAVGSILDLNLDSSGYFCSEHATAAIQQAGLLPEIVFLVNHRTGRLVKTILKPSHTTPCELAAKFGVIGHERGVLIKGAGNV